MKIWGCKKAQKISFLQNTRVKNNISENGFCRVVQFTLVHLVFDGLRILYRLDQASVYRFQFYLSFVALSLSKSSPLMANLWTFFSLFFYLMCNSKCTICVQMCAHSICGFGLIVFKWFQNHQFAKLNVLFCGNRKI